MTNILPPDRLKEMRRFYRARAVLVGALAGCACAMIALLSLLPTYSLTAVKEGEEERASVQTPSPRSSDREEIAHTQGLLKELRPIASSTPSLLSFIEAALSARPKGVSVQSIQLARAPEDTLVLGGIASSRDTINAYRTALSNDPRFTSASVPIGFLAGSESGRFTITLTGDF